jgi:superfamily II DNA or RNA helicase
MSDSESIRNLNIFKSVFKGRNDVYAVRWEKDSKAGYMPAYQYDPHWYRLHKMKGGSFQDYKEKRFLPLTDEQLLKHLEGHQFIGLYPLLENNTSWFIAADFDKENWVDECRTFVQACTAKNFLVYLERSRSGNGCHVWLFFDKPYPAVRSRKIFISILEECGVLSVFDKSSSFDRLFPNQDFLSGKGLGNLIALPLNKTVTEKGNGCFIDPVSLLPYPDQWKFLENVKRISTEELDQVYNNLSLSTERPITERKYGKLTILLSNAIRINRIGLTRDLINFLKEELNFLNTEYLIKKKAGRNPWGTERYFKFVNESENYVAIPRGMAGRLLRFCKEQNLEYEFIDERKKVDITLFSCKIALQKHQVPAVKAATRKDMGVLVAPPGSGKTVIALKLIAEKQQPALIVVHRKQLADQWIERIQTFLEIPKHEIGYIGQGKNRTGKQITVATIQSLSKADLAQYQTAFGTIIIDECHHIPAEIFRNTVSKLSSYYIYGLTAIPFRKYNDGKLIFIHLGEIISDIKPEQINDARRAKIIVRNTHFDIPFNPKTDQYEVLSKMLIHDSTRNKLILDDIINVLNAGKKAIVITERKEHIDALYLFLKRSYDALTLSGDDTEPNRKAKLKILNDGNFQVLITTGQFFGEGSDIQNVQSLFLVYPFSFRGKLIQYIGRVQRSEVTPTIYDYRDHKIDYLDKLFLKRNTYYRRLEREATLFDEPETNPSEASRFLSIRETIKIPLEQLEFRYGAIAFSSKTNGMPSVLEFEVDNINIRPEFSVLKPYFARTLKMKNVRITIEAEYENGILASQLATSSDIQKINSEIIENVRFRFVSKEILGMKAGPENKGILDLDQLQAGKDNLYKSGSELLEEVLSDESFKHYKQLRYLAQKHEGAIMKVRFLLEPFSFVFLVGGQQQFHLVLETLDTEEATYIWHLPKIKTSLPPHVRAINEQLMLIRNKGRQAFLENPPGNFSRVMHDYSDERKGFVLWKDSLEEKLV